MGITWRGYIAPDDGSEDVFIHFQAVINGGSGDFIDSEPILEFPYLSVSVASRRLQLSLASCHFILAKPIVFLIQNHMNL